MFNVTVKGLEGFKRDIVTAAKQVREIVSAEVDAAGAEFVSGARRDAPVDQGALRGAITYYMENDLSAVIVAQKFYAPFIEFGTKGKYTPIPGTESIAAAFKGYRGGDFQQMLRMIALWAGRKGLTGRYSVKTRRRLGSKGQKQAEDLAAAWPIAMSILRNGIKPQPFFFKQMEVVWPKMVSNIERALKSQTRISVILPGELRKPRIINR